MFRLTFTLFYMTMYFHDLAYSQIFRQIKLENREGLLYDICHTRWPNSSLRLFPDQLTLVFTPAHTGTSQNIYLSSLRQVNQGQV